MIRKLPKKSNTQNSKKIYAKQFVATQFRKLILLIKNEDDKVHQLNTIKKSFFSFIRNKLNSSNFNLFKEEIIQDESQQKILNIIIKYFSLVDERVLKDNVPLKLAYRKASDFKIHKMYKFDNETRIFIQEFMIDNQSQPQTFSRQE